MKALWIILAVLIVLSPLGLLASGTAWGEWAPEELHAEGLSFIPEGLQSLSGIWRAPLPDYEIPGLDASVGYILSGVFGVAVTALVAWLLGKWLARGEGSAQS